MLDDARVIVQLDWPIDPRLIAFLMMLGRAEEGEISVGHRKVARLMRNSGRDLMILDERADTS